MVGDRLLGTLSFGSYERNTICSDDVDFLTRVAQYLSIALDRALRERALQEAQQALRDHVFAAGANVHVREKVEQSVVSVRGWR
jgi:GAF domain-containing protein